MLQSWWEGITKIWPALGYRIKWFVLFWLLFLQLWFWWMKPRMEYVFVVAKIWLSTPQKSLGVWKCACLFFDLVRTLDGFSFKKFNSSCSHLCPSLWLRRMKHFMLSEIFFWNSNLLLLQRKSLVAVNKISCCCKQILLQLQTKPLLAVKKCLGTAKNSLVAKMKSQKLFALSLLLWSPTIASKTLQNALLKSCRCEI